MSRSDTAFDADYNSLGVGLKTFISKGNSSTEKVAEFNNLSRDLKNYKGKELALKLGEYRNERIDLANRVYDIESSLYHIVARREKELLLFETEYNQIDLANIHSVKSNEASLQFEDGHNFYSFNYSKSTLFRKFIIPQDPFRLPINIIEDPYSLIIDLFSQNEFKNATDKLKKGEDYVILPLYGIKNNKKFVFEKSGLNQWNAGGRKRDISEIYIPVPIDIHKYYPDFFPNRDEHFDLQIPTGEIFQAKVCQDNCKALMTSPNKALSDWLLRKVLQLKEGELATVQKLNKLGFDSIILTKEEQLKYKIDIMKIDSYDKFLE